MGKRRGRADVAGWTDEFVDDIFPAEYETVMARRREVARRAAGSGDASLAEAPDRATGGPLVPSTTLRLFGLAFSGGGIRSATFNLGVLQAMHRYGLFRFVDYMSTVSGGGYLGTAVSSMMASNAE
ncbi:MAG: patatin-like phospholipase family protein, partial [Myxococcales bacterium]|nr:patatin-like phospholipase family protein [Myxococcales bacterium]